MARFFLPGARPELNSSPQGARSDVGQAIPERDAALASESRRGRSRSVFPP